MTHVKDDLSNETVPRDFIGEKEWFFLLWVAKIRSKCEGPISTPNLIKEVPYSQQTASRRILSLISAGYLSRSFHNNEGYLDLTVEAYVQLEKVYDDLQQLFTQKKCLDQFHGRLVEGMGEGGHYIRHPRYLEQFYKKIGFFPYFGTLNLQLDKEIYNLLMKHLKNLESVQITGFTDQSRTYGDVECYKVLIWPENDIHRQVSGALLRIQRTSHDPYTLEFICEQYLREFLQLENNDVLRFRFVWDENECL